MGFLVRHTGNAVLMSSYLACAVTPRIHQSCSAEYVRVTETSALPLYKGHVGETKWQKLRIIKVWGFYVCYSAERVAAKHIISFWNLRVTYF